MVGGSGRMSSSRHPSLPTESAVPAHPTSDPSVFLSLQVPCCLIIVYPSPLLAASGARTMFCLSVIPSYFVQCLTQSKLSIDIQPNQSRGQVRIMSAKEGRRWLRWQASEPKLTGLCVGAGNLGVRAEIPAEHFIML